MKKLTNKVVRRYAAGQLGWALLASIVTAQLTAIWTGFELDKNTGETWNGFIPIAVFSVIFMLSKVFDAISDPIVGYFSDKARTKWGRRIPFMAASSLPFAIVTILIFVGLSTSQSAGMIALNSVFLIIMIIGFYVALTCYTIPYTSLISDLGKSAEERVKLSTSIAISYFIGSLLAYGAPTVWTMIHNLFGMELRWAIVVTMIVFSTIGFIFLLVPVLTIKEKDFVNFSTLKTEKGKIKLWKTIKDVLKDRKFRWFILADFMYWIGLIIFQSQVNAIITSILGIKIENAIFFVGVMGIVSFSLYGPVAMLMNKIGVRKRLLQISFFMFFVLFTLGGLMMLNRDQLGEPLAWAEGLIFVAVAGIPMAILGIIENVVVSDVIEYRKVQEGRDEAASFYAVRNLTMKMGQAAGMGLGTLFLIAGNTSDNPLGVRLMLAFAAIATLGGFIAMFFYEEIRYRGTRKMHKVINLRNQIDTLKNGKTISYAGKIHTLEAQIEENNLRIPTLKNKGDVKWLKAENADCGEKIKKLKAKEKELQAKEIQKAKDNAMENQEKIANIQKEIDSLVNANRIEIKEFVAKRIKEIKVKLSRTSSSNAAKFKYLNDEIARYQDIETRYSEI